MVYKVGVSTGLYTVARSEELSDVLKKLGFGLTRGTSVIEITCDIPHEIDISTGKKIIDIAEKQGLELTLHGSLTVPLEMPERGEWRDADDHMKKSLRSAVFAGCKYVNFHTCLNIWLELMTYAGRKLTMSFCDHEGHFITKILKESEKLRKWFIEEKGDLFYHDIFSREEIRKISAEVEIATEEWRKEETSKRLRDLLMKASEIPNIIQTRGGSISKSDYIDELIHRAIITNTPPETHIRSVDERIVELFKQLRAEVITHSVDVQREIINRFMEEKFRTGGKWHTEELRTVVGVLDGYHIMAHYLFYTQDPIWKEMVEMYRDTIVKKYKIDYNDFWWLDNAWKRQRRTMTGHSRSFSMQPLGRNSLRATQRRSLGG